MSGPCSRPECGGEVHTDGWGTPIRCPETVRQEALRQMDADPHGLKAGLIVKPYTEHGQQKWVFRCWGTDSCDGWLSLDHSSEQSAERARDRHVAESHPELRLLRDMNDCRFCGEPEGSINHPGSEALAKGAPGHEYSPPTSEATDLTEGDSQPEPSLLEQAQATVESLRYQIRRARECLAEDERDQAEDAIDQADRCSCGLSTPLFSIDRAGQHWHSAGEGVLAPTGVVHNAADERLRQAEIRAAVAEHEAEAYRNQVQALVREILRERDVPEELLPARVRVILLDEEAP